MTRHTLRAAIVGAAAWALAASASSAADLDRFRFAATPLLVEGVDIFDDGAATLYLGNAATGLYTLLIAEFSGTGDLGRFSSADPYPDGFLLAGPLVDTDTPGTLDFLLDIEDALPPGVIGGDYGLIRISDFMSDTATGGRSATLSVYEVSGVSGVIPLPAAGLLLATAVAALGLRRRR